jgi:hypothetical protein
VVLGTAVLEGGEDDVDFRFLFLWERVKGLELTKPRTLILKEVIVE